MNMTRWKGKRVKIILHNEIVYTGTVIDTSECAITILDKFNKLVMLEEDEIKRMGEIDE